MLLGLWNAVQSLQHLTSFAVNGYRLLQGFAATKTSLRQSVVAKQHAEGRMQRVRIKMKTLLVVSW